MGKTIRFGLHLPNLPKKDYDLLKHKASEWHVSYVQVVLIALRCLEPMETLSPKKLDQLIQEVE